jgi:hypothetical protein
MGTKGERLTNPIELFSYESVWVERWKRPCATSFLISMQFRTLMLFFNGGIYKYTKQDKLNKKQFHEIVKWKQH